MEGRKRIKKYILKKANTIVHVLANLYDTIFLHKYMIYRFYCLLFLSCGKLDVNHVKVLLKLINYLHD